MKSIAQLAAEMQRHLTTDILPFWMNEVRDGMGGFYGRISGEGEVFGDADRGAILYSRILWTFSAAYRIQIGRASCRERV